MILIQYGDASAHIKLSHLEGIHSVVLVYIHKIESNICVTNEERKERCRGEGVSEAVQPSDKQFQYWLLKDAEV